MSETKTLIQKLAEACNEIGGVEKKGRNQLQGYDYVRAADVANLIRHRLFERGIMILADEQGIEWRDFTTAKGSVMRECTLKVMYTITDGVTEIKLGAYGVAMDSGDKSSYKSKTGALKYFLRNLGLIPDDNDPEADEGVDKATSGVSVQMPKPLRSTDTTIMPQNAPPTQHEQTAYANPLSRSGDDMPANDPPKGTVISAAQAKRLFAISKDVKMPQETLRQILGAHGYEHSNEIDWKKYKTIVEEVQNWKAV